MVDHFTHFKQVQISRDLKSPIFSNHIKLLHKVSIRGIDCVGIKVGKIPLSADPRDQRIARSINRSSSGFYTVYIMVIIISITIINHINYTDNAIKRLTMFLYNGKLVDSHTSSVGF